MRLTVEAKASVKARLSVQHLLAAARFSRHVCRLEKANAGKPFGPFWEEINAFATACVLVSVASIESYVNELFVDYQKHFPKMRADLMKKLWEFVEQKSLLEKYELALLLREAPGFDRGAKPYQDIDALVSLRNALTHFKPEWDDEEAVHKKVSAKLKGRFLPSPFMGGGNPLFPKRWATSGCTKWAVQSALAFLCRFEELAGIDHRFDKYAHRLAVD